uniref:NADH dehydrogenase subunit 2 n=1 Tax=Lottia goshimai TaxID=1824450 RepID=UPI0021152DC4|nr:NADH dehydrogenase subunit 2 [Lottia goshimai]UTM92227.1 NADH dehydrogenase subunit 2 [Lottia peitaihoensis]
MWITLLPASLLFFVLTLTSGLLVISSSSWIFSFAGLVLNTAAITPNLIQFSPFGWKSGEAAGKYFLVQAKASSTFALGSAVFWHWDSPTQIFLGLTPTEWGLIFLFSSMILKLGLFPFYAWIPGVMSGLSWTNCWLVLTWQKYFPLVIALQVTTSSASNFFQSIVMLTVSTTAILGALLGLGQTNLRALVAYSSLVHGSWSLMASILGMKTLALYMIVYTCTLGTTVFMFSRSSARSVQDPKILVSVSPAATILSILSLAGAPPLLGFFGKWLVIAQWTNMEMVTLPLSASLLGSLISLNFYLSMCWGLFWASSSELSLKKLPNPTHLSTVFSLNILASMQMALLITLN